MDGSLEDAASVGAYASSSSDSRGDPFIRKSIVNYIQERDGVDADWKNIHMTNGASEGIRRALNLCLGNDSDGVIVGVPYNPIYSPLLSLNGA